MSSFLVSFPITLIIIIKKYLAHSWGVQFTLGQEKRHSGFLYSWDSNQEVGRKLKPEKGLDCDPQSMTCSDPLSPARYPTSKIFHNHPRQPPENHCTFKT